MSGPPPTVTTQPEKPAVHVRTLTVTGSRLPPFPKRAGFALLGAILIGIPASPNASIGLVRLLYVLAAVVAAFSGCAIANWAELRLYRGLASVTSVRRTMLTFLVPLLALLLSPIPLTGAGLFALVDDGVLLSATLVGGAWFLSACAGTMVVVLLDVMTRALIDDFRSRIQAAVLGLMTLTAVTSWTLFAVGRALTRLFRVEAAKNNDLKMQFGDHTLEGQAALDFLAGPETEAAVMLAVVVVTTLVALPAIISACGKLADTVMERINPLIVAMETVGKGDLAVRVEEGGSRELVQVAAGFNRMAGSLSETLDQLDFKNRELTETNVATSRFVPFQFLELLNKSTVRDIARGDQTELEMSVMFADIRDFTTLAERIGPERTFAFINRYLAAMEEQIRRERGFINDFAGDGIMALFGGGADSALRAAVEMVRAKDALNRQLQSEGAAPIRIGIGVNSGRLMMGTIGGRDRLSCTVIGDPVNMAARVEGMTKLYGCEILITEATLARLKRPDDFVVREVDRVTAKGKLEPASIFEVRCPGDRSRHANHEQFATALAAYRRGAFMDARNLFQGCVEIARDDLTAQLYVERCDEFITGEPPVNWDGITHLSHK